MNENFIKEIEVSNCMIAELGKFSLLWNAFECNFFQTKCSVTKIRNFEHYDKINNEVYFTNLIKELLNYLEIDMGRITRNFIKNKLYSPERNEYQFEVENVLKQNLHGKDLQIGVLLVLLRIRNNMFHGLKDCFSINKQYNLFVSANALLNYILITLL